MCNWQIPLSDNWWIEDGKAWFCSEELCALFCMDLHSQTCEFVSQIPGCNIWSYGFYTYCIKYENMVFCIPKLGENIWIYNLESELWEKMKMANGCQMLFCARTYRKNDSMIWLLNSSGNVFEVNLKKRAAQNVYNILTCKNQLIGEYVRVGDRLYCVSGKCVYCIDVRNYSTITYEMPDVKMGLLTICYDGIDFWLSSLSNEIYVWNPKSGILKVIVDFSQWSGKNNIVGERCFLMEDHLYFDEIDELLHFTTSISAGKYIWYMPWLTNQIIYIDKRNYEIFSLDINGEAGTEANLRMDRTAKYLAAYILEDRYIGIYSYKSRKLFEIDTTALCVREKTYTLNEDFVLKATKAMVAYNEQKILNERVELEQRLFIMLLDKNESAERKNIKNIGRLIYQSIDRQSD